METPTAPASSSATNRTRRAPSETTATVTRDDDAATASRVDDETRDDDEPLRHAPASRERSDDGHADDSPELLPREENAEFQRRWETIQTGFVDEPRQTVEQADELVAHVMKRLAEGFAAERERLEGQWGRGEDVSTEDLRVALQRYRGVLPAAAVRVDHEASATGTLVPVAGHP